MPTHANTIVEVEEGSVEHTVGRVSTTTAAVPMLLAEGQRIDVAKALYCLFWAVAVPACFLVVWIGAVPMQRAVDKDGLNGIRENAVFLFFFAPLGQIAASLCVAGQWRSYSGMHALTSLGWTGFVLGWTTAGALLGMAINCAVVYRHGLIVLNPLVGVYSGVFIMCLVDETIARSVPGATAFIKDWHCREVFGRTTFLEILVSALVMAQMFLFYMTDSPGYQLLITVGTSIFMIFLKTVRYNMRNSLGESILVIDTAFWIEMLHAFASNLVLPGVSSGGVFVIAAGATVLPSSMALVACSDFYWSHMGRFTGRSASAVAPAGITSNGGGGGGDDEGDEGGANGSGESSGDNGGGGGGGDGETTGSEVQVAWAAASPRQVPEPVAHSPAQTRKEMAPSSHVPHISSGLPTASFTKASSGADAASSSTVMSQLAGSSQTSRKTSAARRASFLLVQRPAALFDSAQVGNGSGAGDGPDGGDHDEALVPRPFRLHLTRLFFVAWLAEFLGEIFYLVTMLCMRYGANREFFVPTMQTGSSRTISDDMLTDSLIFSAAMCSILVVYLVVASRVCWHVWRIHVLHDAIPIFYEYTAETVFVVFGALGLVPLVLVAQSHPPLLLEDWFLDP